MKLERATFLGVFSLCAALACELGGGDGDGGGPGPGPGTTVTLGSTSALDGWVRSGDGASATASGITGDLDAISSAAGKGYRQFFSFDLITIPPGATITAATLELYQQSVQGTPYAKLGNVLAEHVDYGPTLEGPGDYDVTPLAPGATLSTTSSVGYKQLVVTARVQADIAAGRTRSQFRLRFSISDSNNDGATDHAQFTEAEFPANTPRLVVTYN